MLALLKRAENDLIIAGACMTAWHRGAVTIEADVGGILRAQEVWFLRAIATGLGVIK